MKVLFFHSNHPDYLGDSLFHGLRTLLGKNCVDIPRYDSMYSPLADRIRSKLRGNGFSLYGLLSEIPELANERYFWRKDLDNYDLVVVSNLGNLWSLFWELSTLVASEKLVIIDGEDSPAFFPYISMKWRLQNYPWTYLTPVGKHKYFKRELIAAGASYGLDRFLPYLIRRRITLPKNAYPLGFSIPLEKITKIQPEAKIKDFPTHIVDEEVAKEVDKSFFSAIGSDKHLFTTEKDYYHDLQKSRFGITTKRAGWDCLRHYELAANGCVLCFRDLDLKPATCAPHGLDESNCIVYHSYEELRAKVASLTDKEYARLQGATYDWVQENSTVACANKFLKVCLPGLRIPSNHENSNENV